MVKQRHCSGRKPIIAYGNNMITHKSTYNVSSDEDEWSHSSGRRNHIKTSKYNNKIGGGETTPFCSEENNDDI